MSTEFEKMMEQHFADDNKHFGELNRKTDKLSEQLTQNGEHFSYFSKNLVELKGMVEEQIKINTEQNKRLDKHIERVEPMIKAYEINTQFENVLSTRVKKWGGRVTFLAALVAAIIYLRYEVIKLLQ